MEDKQVYIVLNPCHCRWRRWSRWTSPWSCVTPHCTAQPARTKSTTPSNQTADFQGSTTQGWSKNAFLTKHILISSQRFGPLPCVTTTQQVKAGEELFSYYRFTQSEIQPHDFRMYTVQDVFLLQVLALRLP